MTVMTHPVAQATPSEIHQRVQDLVQRFCDEKARLLDAGIDCSSQVLHFVENALPECLAALRLRDPQDEIQLLLEHVGDELSAAVRAREYLNDPELLREAESLVSLSNMQARLTSDATQAAQETGAPSDVQFAFNALGEYRDRLAKAAEFLTELVNSRGVCRRRQEIADHARLADQCELTLTDLRARILAKRPPRIPL